MEKKLALERAISASLRYVTSNQSEDGSWVDWQLPVGESDAWITGYVGYKLRFLPSLLKSEAEVFMSKAYGWLLEHEYAEGGWGYNEGVGSDADSTAFAILFLASEGKIAHARSFDCLKRFQMEDGGFSTYVAKSKHDSWGVSHPDVTPIALLALLTKYGVDDVSVSRGIEYVLRHRSLEGWWDSFWWDSCLYSTQANVSFLNSAKVTWDVTGTIEFLNLVKTKNAFEDALLISIMLEIPHDPLMKKACQLADHLIKEQDQDGSWRSEPILRVTRNNCFEPWAQKSSGNLFGDPKRLLTSSTILDSLCRVYALNSAIS